MARRDQFNATGYTTHPDPGPLFSLGKEVERGHRPASPSSLRGSVASSLPHPPLPTSTEIAATISTSRRQRILQFLSNFGPHTLHEFCQACTSGQVTVHAHQVSGRFTDLAREAFIVSIGERPHPVSGAACQVWEITERGRQELDRIKTGGNRR